MLALLGLATVASGLACSALLGITDVPTPNDAATGVGRSQQRRRQQLGERLW